MPTPLAPSADAGEGAHPPRWHTLVLVALLVIVAAAGTLSSLHGSAPKVPESRILGAYFPVVIVNAVLALYVTRLGRGRSALGELVGRRWDTAARALADAALAGLTAAVILLTEYAWRAAFGAPERAWANAILPATPLERAAWVVVAVTVGTSEELLYRGYLQRELGALIRSRTLGLLAQAALFALAHGEQGPGAVVRTFCYGAFFGVLAAARKSLLPCIVAHVGIDLAAGLVRG